VTGIPDAVSFAEWLLATVAVIGDDAVADVPCGDCNACCRTSLQVHLRPGERQARKRLPKKSLSVAPGLPPGYLLLACDETGCCPVLVGGRCTIYDDRPLVCRTYDCRLYAATDVAPDRVEIATQVRRWRFSHPTADDRALHDAVLAAARFIRERPACVPGEAARRQPIRAATLAVAVHSLFLQGATVGLRRRPARESDRIRAVAYANEELFGDG